MPKIHLDLQLLASPAPLPSAVIIHNDNDEPEEIANLSITTLILAKYHSFSSANLSKDFQLILLVSFLPAIEKVI